MFFICKECNDTRNETEVIILDCKHCFCLVCFEKYLLSNFAKEFKCPLNRCNTKISEDQLREILSDEDLRKYNALCLEDLPRIHRCILPECNNVIQYEEGQTSYTCSQCSLCNCIQCNSCHSGLSCDAFKSLTEDEAKELSEKLMEKAKVVNIHNNRKSFFEAQKKDLSVNDRVFECMHCCHCIGKGKGIMLRTCFHYICKTCMIKLVKNTHTIPVSCPKAFCNCIIEDREVKSILTKSEYDVYERKGLNSAKKMLDNVFQCRQANCGFFGTLEDYRDKTYKCPLCKTKNCMICMDVHPGSSCKEHQQRIRSNDSAIENSISKGEFMRCPGCGNYVSKSRGCNWIKCPRCNLELCWIMKMPRWGPRGKGDTSGGCKCEVNKYCHPSCTGCIPDS